MVSPYRSDQVGSLLRPAALLDARAAPDAAESREAREDEAILEALSRQRDTGISVLVDGEFRRSAWSTGFVDAVEGFVTADDALPWHDRAKERTQAAPGPAVVGGRLVPRRRICAHEVEFLKSHAKGPFKITLPSPSVFVVLSYKEGVTDRHYSREGLLDALTEIVRAEVEALAADGVPYIQLDAPQYSFFLDEQVRQQYFAGADVDRLLSAAVDADATCLDGIANDAVTTGVHICRGNRAGMWVAQGGYEPIAEQVLAKTRAERLLLEYDTERSGGFEPLRHVPDDVTVVLGLVTTKLGALERRSDLLRRIEEAASFHPIERLALSPQCGFASHSSGNPLTVAEQWAKLELVATVADEVWGR